MAGEAGGKSKHKGGNPEVAIRPAARADIPALVALERRTFTGDWVSARSFRELIRRGHALTLVEEWRGEIRGYALLFFRRGSRVGRLYSFAVAPEHRGQGLAKVLLAAAERAAREHGASLMRLEVRADNVEAKALYARLGYRPIGSTAAYYDDGMDAVRMEKRLLAQAAGN